MSANPSKDLLSDRTTATITAENGEVTTKPTILLTNDEARMLREYRQFLLRRGLKEALFCNNCFQQGDMARDGVKMFVTPNQIAIECRCSLRFYQGQTL